jgi:hypothetical protein
MSTPTIENNAIGTLARVDRAGSAWKYAALFTGFLVLVTGSTALGNFLLNPLTYNPSQQTAAAEALATGHGVAIADSNIDWRDLRRENIAWLNDTPDIVIFGGSRWQEASSDVAPGQKLYNAFVSNDHFEDMMAISELLYVKHRLPKTLILSVRFSTFEYLGRRDAWWWKSFGPEYRDMAKRLGVESHPWYDTIPIGKWIHLLSLDALLGKLRQYWDLETLWRVTERWPEHDLDVVAPDGSLHFSDSRLAAENSDYAQRNATTMAALHRTTRLKVDPTLVAQLGQLTAFLKGQGVRVVFAQTPFHPAYFEAIQGSSYYEDLRRIEAELERVATVSGAEVVGSFDAVREGCSGVDYRDFNHARLQCLRRILAPVLER